MRKNPAAAVAMRTLVAAAALVSLTSAALFSSAEPAAAKSCLQRAIECSDRCAARNKDDIGAVRRCNQRTCNHQLRNCEGVTPRPEAGPRGPAGKAGPVVRDKRKPRRTNVTTPVIQPAPRVQPQPATTGSGASTARGRPVVRDHRGSRPAPGGSTVKPR